MPAASSDQGDLFAAEDAPATSPKLPAKAPSRKKKDDSTALPEAGSLARLPKRISPSRLKDFMQCPKLFYYKTILGIPTPNTIHTARGTIAHTAFELVFDHDKDNRTPDVALSYVRPAWKVMVDPLAERSAVEPGSPEERIRIAYDSFRDLVEPGSKKEKQMLSSAADYVEVIKKEAATQGSTPEETEEELLSSAEDMVRGWYGMEKPEKFEPAGRELHLQAKTSGTTLHGFIDRLDKIPGKDGDERVFISDYKCAAVTEPIPTPSGWTTMGEVQVGEYVIGADGRPTKVVVKSGIHNRDCYRVEFDDKTSVVCDDEHLWQVSYGVPNKVNGGWVKTQVMSTLELVAFKQEGKYPVWVDNAAPLVLPEADLPLDPYILGAWLGDGDSTHGLHHAHQGDLEHFVVEFSRLGEEVFDTAYLNSSGSSMHKLRLTRRESSKCRYGHTSASGTTTGCAPCRRGDRGYPTHSTLSARLRYLEVLGNKHVPAAYLRGSIEQRLALLQGLMDTDGSWNKIRNQAVFSTTKPGLADAVQELVHSLGSKSTRFEKDYADTSVGAGRYIQVMFTPVDFNPFRLQRKAVLVRPETPRKAKRRSITAVVPVESVPTQCVGVDSDDHLFLIGRQMVPTHNTGKVPGEGKNYRPQVQARIEDEAFFAMKVYALLYYELNKVIPTALRLLYVRKGDQTGVKTLPITPAIINQTRKQVASIWRQITQAAKTEVWEPKTGPLCNWCYFQDVCPAFNDGIDRLLPEQQALRGEPVVDEADVMVPPAAAIAETEPFSESASDDATPQEHTAVRIEAGVEPLDADADEAADKDHS